MQNYTLLYVGSGLIFVGLLIALPLGLFAAIKQQNKGFRYGSFILSSSLIAVPATSLAMIAFAYQFLGVIAPVLAIPSLLCFAGVLAAYRYLDFRSKSLMISVSVPYILSLYFSPIALLNCIYIFWIYKPAKPDASLS